MKISDSKYDEIDKKDDKKVKKYLEQKIKSCDDDNWCPPAKKQKMNWWDDEE